MNLELVKIEGLSECLAALDALPDRITQLAVRDALTEASQVLADRARDLVPVKPPNKVNSVRYGAVMGALRASIKVLPTTINRTWVNCTVSAGSKVAYYARFVEFGTDPHDIKGNLRKALNFDGYVRDVIHHPGSKPIPFMRIALDAGAQDAISRFTQIVKQRIDSGLNQ